MASTGTFFGISVASSALSAQRRAMDLLGYNVAHANDPTYKRQRMVMVEGMVLAQSQEASSLGVSPFGTGVNSGDVERVRDSLIENRLRHATTASANWDFRSSTLAQLEAALGEPSDSGLQNDLNNFWSSWQKVATQPQSVPLRGALLEDTQALCQRMQYVYRQMHDMTEDLNLATVDRVNQVNLMAEEIARLNNEIGALEPGHIPVNDLMNRRDALVLELSKVIDISQHGEGKESFIISVGGRVLVQGTLVNRLATETAGGAQQVEWEDDGTSVSVTGGELRAVLDLRDSIIPGYLSQLDDVAEQLVGTVNALHRTGKTLAGADGGDFFKIGSTAANLALDDAIIASPQLVAASATGAIGDGSIAQQISGLAEKPTATGFSINQMYRNLIGDLGSTTAAADTQSTAHRLSVEQFLTQQQSVSGVSLDEEMVNMIKFQQAYNAAARTLTVMDEMLGVLIMQTGAIGR